MITAAVIPAAGSGSRFGEDKLARSLGGRPVLVRAVEAMARRDEIRQIIVAGPPDDLERFKAKFGAALGFLGATIVAGGRIDRWETVAAALQHVSDECTHVAVHDAARPCPSGAMLDRLFLAAKHLDAVVPGIAVSSSLKSVDIQGASIVRDADVMVDAILGDASDPGVRVMPVVATVQREALVMVQTPQIMKVDLLRRAFDQVDPTGCTDEASLIERLGEVVHVVEGDPLNVKITVPADWALAEAALTRTGSGP